MKKTLRIALILIALAPITSVFAGVSAEASKYKGTLPLCISFFDTEESHGLIMFQLGLVQKGKKVDLIYRVWNSPNTTTPTYEKTLARDFTCEYSNHHIGVMHCTNPDKEVFTVSQEKHISLSPYGQAYDVENPYFYFKVRVTSQEVSRMYNAGEYVLIKAFHPASTRLTDAEYSELTLGKLPLFQSELSWAQAEQMKQFGSKVFGGTFSLEVGQNSCAFAPPQPAP